MTLLEMVNSVLRSLREDQVTTIDETEYSRMAAEFIRDAYKFVEDAWNWTSLRTDLTVTTEEGVQEYTVSGLTMDSDIFWVYGTDFLKPETPWWLVQQSGEGVPTHYVITGTDESTGNLKVKFSPAPDDVYSITFRVVQRGLAPTDNTDHFKVPTDPIRHMALVLMTRERGETGGTSATEYTVLYERSLGDAIARDAKLHTDELILTPV
jgi:hypothetical protein